MQMSAAHLGLLATYGAQLLVGLALIAVFLHFFRAYRQEYLRDWCIAYAALCLYLVAAAISAHLAITRADLGVRLWWSWLSQVAAYLQVALLLRGALGLKHAAAVARIERTRVIAAALLLGTALTFAWAFDPDAAQQRLIIRLGLRYAVCGIAFIVTAAILMRRLRQGAGAGLRFAVFAFAFSGALLLTELAVFAWQVANDQRLPGAEFLGLLELVGQAAIGFALIVWVADEERIRADRASAESERLRLFDGGTGLPNRGHAAELLAGDLEAAGDGTFAVVAVHLPDLDAIGHSHGTARADALAAAVAADLDDALPKPGRRVARIAGHRLAAWLPWDASIDALTAVLDKCIEVVSRPRDVAGERLALAAHVGVAMSDWAGRDTSRTASALLDQAELAIPTASRFGFHAPDLAARARDHVARIGEVQAALAAREFTPWYQPVVRAGSHVVVGFEMLARWRHRTRGIVQPSEFLHILDQRGTIVDLDRQLLREACAWAASHPADRASTLSVNVSARAFDAPGYVDEVLRTLDASGLAPGRLQLEITESIAMADASRTRRQLQRLRDCGVRVALDDFGTGFSSLVQLRELPVDTLKIDRSFVAASMHDPRSETIARAITALGRALGVDVVAEGIETPEEVARFESFGASHLQGYWFAMPAPADAAFALLGAVLPSSARSGPA